MALHRNPVRLAPRLSLGSLARLLLVLTAGAGLNLPAASAADLVPGAAPCFTNAIPAGYGSFLLLKNALFSQSTGANPVAAGALAQITLQSPAAYLASNAIVTGPASFKANLVLAGDRSSSWSDTGTEAELMARLPAGAWSTQFQLVFTNADTFVGFFPFLLASNLPPVPAVLNLAAAQSIDPAASFRLSWNPWVGASANDRISLQVFDGFGRLKYSAASDCSGNNALAAGAGFVDIPALTFAANSTYTAYLTLGGNLLAAQDDSTMMVERGEQSRTTRFTLKTTTAGTGGTPGDLLNPTVSGTNLVFTVKGTPGGTYAIESTADFVAWVREQTVTLPATGQAEVTVPIPPSGAPRFYRATSTGGTTTPPSPASLALTQLGPDQLQITVAGTPGAVYALESSDTFATWTKVAETNLPAGGTATFIVAIAPGTTHLNFRAVGTAGAVTPGTRPQPTLAVGIPTVSGNFYQTELTLTGGEANKTYTLQQSSNLRTWQAVGQTIRTDAKGSGRVSVPIARNGQAVFGGPAQFYRAFIR